MSHVASYFPIIAALQAAEQMPGMGGAGITWTGSNDVQTQFLTEVFGPGYKHVAGLPIESLASKSVDEINAFLAARGFSITLRHIGPQDFAVASVLDLLIQWLDEGTPVTVNTPSGSFPGAKLKGGAVDLFRGLDHPSPIALLKTRSDYTVGMTMLDEPPPTGMALMGYIKRLTTNLSYHSRNEGLIFPMVDMDLKEEMSWLLGLSAHAEDGRPAVISQAVRQDKLRMNHKGARAQTAVAVAVMRGISPPPLVIDRPFVVWFERAGLPFPIFSAYVTQEHWREPASLD